MVSTLFDMITIQVETEDEELKALEVPTDMGLNLMEILKAYDYGIQATCGGMGLCATCHIEILEGSENLPEPKEGELATLDELPDAGFFSRLACQIRPEESMDGLVIRLKVAETV
jgi:ferredoxin